MGEDATFPILETYQFNPAVLTGRYTLEEKAILLAATDNVAVARQDLERIIHPAVRSAIDTWFESLGDIAPGFAIADIPLLYETGRERDFETVVVTACDPPTQIARIMDRDAITEAEARARVAAQLPIEEKVRRADHVISTDGSYEETNRQVREGFAALTG